MAAAIRVLYVDDERPLRDVGKKFLERSGNFTVFTAESASEALALIKEQHIDVIISDCQMPAMGGIDFLKAVRNTDLDIPFVFFSGKGTKETVIEAFKHGADRYIEKRGEPEFLFEDLQHIVTEIVTLRNTDRALHENEKLFREVFNNANDAMFLHEMTPKGPGKYIQVNEVAIRWLGYTRDEFLTMTLHDIVPEPVFSGVVPETMKSLFENGQATFESVHKRKDGSTYPVEVSTHTFMLNNRQVALSIAREITKRREAEIALRESEQRYRSLFENMLDGFAYCRMIFDDQDRPVDFVYLDVNSAFEQLTGLKNVVGKRVTEVIPGIRESNPELFLIYGRVASTGKPEEFEINFKPLARWLSIKVYCPEKGYFVAIFDNITERKQAEAALQLKDFAIVSSINAIAIADLSGNLTYVNPAFLSIWEYEDEKEVIGRSVLSFWMVTDEAQQVVDGLQVHGNWSGEMTGQKKDGTPVQVQLSANLIRNASGTPVAMMASFVDITERKRAERRLQDIIAQNPMSIQIVDKDGFTLTVNSAHTRLFGAVMPSDFSIFNDVQLIQKGFGELLERIKNGEVVNFPDTNYNAHDSVSECPDVPVWVHTVVFPLKDNYGKPEQFVLMHENITERKRAEDALRASEQRYRDVVEDQTEFICRFLPDGKLTFINEAYCNYFWLTREDCIGKRHSVVLPPEEAQQMKDHLAALTPENPVAAISHRIVMPSGEVRWQRWSDRAIFDREGNVIEYQSVGRDITRQKETETQLENYKETLEHRVRDRTSELSETNLKLKKEIEDRKKIQKKLTISSNEKDFLLSEVHHRVKNNLQLIIGLIDMTKTRAHDPAVLSTLTDIMAKVQTMGLVHARLHESKRFDKINMKWQVHDLVNMISGFYDHEHLDITTTIDCAEIYLPVDQAIPSALALNEIISNIYKHAFKGRRTGVVEISLSVKGDQLRIAVRDNGVGLPSGFNIEKSNRLGLKLMRTLVEQQLHGSVTITSKAGTEVVIEFPINRGESDYGTGTGS